MSYKEHIKRENKGHIESYLEYTVSLKLSFLPSFYQHTRQLSLLLISHGVTLKKEDMNHYDILEFCTL